MNQAKPSYILRAGSRLRRSVSSACSSSKTSDTRPRSLFGQYPVIQNRGDIISDGSSKKNELETIEEKSSNGENTCYVIQIGCNNWLGRLDPFLFRDQLVDLFREYV